MTTQQRCLVLAVVTAVRSTVVTYPCCPHCYSKLLSDITNSSWHCLKCRYYCHGYEVPKRYRLALTVADDTDINNLTIFGKTLDTFFGTCATDFHRRFASLNRPDIDKDFLLHEALSYAFVGQHFYFGLKIHAGSGTARLRNVFNNKTDTQQRHSQFSSQLDPSDIIAYQMLPSCNVNMPTVCDYVKVLLAYNSQNLSLSSQVLQRTNCDKPCQDKSDDPAIVSQGSKSEQYDSSSVFTKQSEVVFSFELDKTISQSSTSKSIDTGKKIRQFSQKSRSRNSEGLNYSLGSDGNGSWSSSSVDSPGMCNYENTSECVPNSPDPFDHLTCTDFDMNKIPGTHNASLMKLRSHKCKNSCTESSEKMTPASKIESSMIPGTCVKDTRNRLKLEVHYEQPGCSLNRYLSKSENSLQLQQKGYLYRQQLRSEKEDTEQDSSDVVPKLENNVYADAIRDDTVEKASIKLSLKQSNVGLDVESLSSSSDSLLLLAMDNMNVSRKEQETDIKETYPRQNSLMRDESATQANVSIDLVNVPENGSIVNLSKISNSVEIQSQSYSKLTKSDMSKDGHTAIQQTVPKSSQSRNIFTKNEQFPVKESTSKRVQLKRRHLETNQITTRQSKIRQPLSEDHALLRNRQSKKDQSPVIPRESDQETLKEGPITNSSSRQVSNSSRHSCKSGVTSSQSSAGLQKNSKCGNNVHKKKQISKKNGTERWKQSNSKSSIESLMSTSFGSHKVEHKSSSYLPCVNQKAPDQGPNLRISYDMTHKGNEFKPNSDCVLSSGGKSFQSEILSEAGAIGNTQLDMPESEGIESFLSSQMDGLILKVSDSDSSTQVQPRSPDFTQKESTSKNTCILDKGKGGTTFERMKMMTGRLIESKVDNHPATKTRNEKNSVCSNLQNSKKEKQISEDINNLHRLKIIQQSSSERKQSKVPTHSQSGTKSDIPGGLIVDMPEDIYAFLESFSELSFSPSYKDDNGNVRNREETISESSTADCQHMECLAQDTCICEEGLPNSRHWTELTHSGTFSKRRNQEDSLRNGKTLKPNESFDIKNKYMSSDLVSVKDSGAEKWKEAKLDITKHLASDDPEIFSESLEAYLENSDVFQDRASSANLHILSQANNVKRKQNNLSSGDNNSSVPEKGSLNPYNYNVSHSSSFDTLYDDIKLDPKYYSFKGNDLSESKCLTEVQQGSETLATAFKTCTDIVTSYVPHLSRQVQGTSHGAAFNLSSHESRMDIKKSRNSYGGSQDLFNSSGISMHDSPFGHNEQVDVSNVSLFSSSPFSPAGHCSTPTVSTSSNPKEPSVACIVSGMSTVPQNRLIREWPVLDEDFSSDIDLFLTEDYFSSCKEDSIKTAYMTETGTTIDCGIKGNSCPSNVTSRNLAKIGKANDGPCAFVIVGDKSTSSNKMKEMLHRLDKDEHSEELPRKIDSLFSTSNEVKKGPRTVSKVVCMVNTGNLQTNFDNSLTSPSTTNEAKSSSMILKNTKGMKLATNGKGSETSGSDNSRKLSSPTDKAAHFSKTPGDLENICAESMIISECTFNGSNSSSAEILETGSKPQAKKVTFHSRLRRVSTIQIIDMKMKLTASPVQRPDANPMTLKSCLKTAKENLFGKDKVSSSIGSPIGSQDLFNSNSFEVPRTPVIVLSEMSTDDSLIPGTPCVVSVTGKENMPTDDRPIEAQTSYSKRMSKESQMKHQYSSLKLEKSKHLMGKLQHLQQSNCDVLKDVINLPIETPCLFSDESIGSHDQFSSECLRQKKFFKTRTSSAVENQPCASPYHLNSLDCVISPHTVTSEVSPDLFSPSPPSNCENDIPKVHQKSSLHSENMQYIQDDLCKNLFS